PGSSGNITLTNAPIDITDASSTGAKAMSISNRTGGTITIASPITAGTLASRQTSTPISLSTNSASTFAFTGKLDLWTTGGATAFSANGSGTVTVTDATSTIDAAASSQAIFIQNTAIGAAGITFQSVNA